MMFNVHSILCSVSGASLTLTTVSDMSEIKTVSLPYLYRLESTERLRDLPRASGRNKTQIFLAFLWFFKSTLTWEDGS
jgi:hypothetical protein